MRRDPPDPLAAAYCCFFPGHDLKTVHVFWNHKDDNAARVTPTRPHPWRPLKYPGLHEAVYRYNVYYARQDRDSVWRNAAGELLALPISKREADARCMVYDSGDIFTMIGARVTIDTEDRPYVAFRTGVVDWVKAGRDPSAVIVPLTYRYASCADGKWRVVNRMPSEWPPEVREVLSTPGAQAYGERRPEGRWFIRAEREAIGPGVGCSVFLYHGQMGYAVRKGGPAVVE
jgi:hypothetical protein